NDPVLTVSEKTLKQHLKKEDGTIDLCDIGNCLSFENVKYVSYKKAKSSKSYLLWSFVIFFKGHHILSYRQGRYREDRDSFVNRQTIGSTALLTQRDRSLFDRDDYGLVWGGLSKAIVDLGISSEEFDEPNLKSRSELD